MSVANYIKDPNATLDYSLDWGSWLLAGETIPVLTGSTWTVTSDQAPASGDLTITQSVVVGGVTTAWVTGGIVGTVYTLDCTVTTTGGRTDSRSITLTITER